MASGHDSAQQGGPTAAAPPTESAAAAGPLPSAAAATTPALTPGIADAPAAAAISTAGAANTAAGDNYPSLKRAERCQLGKMVGVQQHKKWAPWFVAQIQAPSVQTNNVHGQWLPTYPTKEQAALAYDIANAWRAIQGIVNVTEETAQFNFQTAGYLQDSALRSVLSTCKTFPEVKTLIKHQLLPPPPYPAELRQPAGNRPPTLKSKKVEQLQAGCIRVDLTAAKLRDSRVYLKPDAIERAFQTAEGQAEVQLIQATATDARNGQQQTFTLPFGTPGRDGLPLVASNLRPLLDVVGAQAGDKLLLRYRGREGGMVQVDASVERAAPPGQEEAALLLSLRPSHGVSAADQVEEGAASQLPLLQQVAPLDGDASDEAAAHKRRRDDSVADEAAVAAKRRVLETAGSSLGAGQEGRQALGQQLMQQPEQEAQLAPQQSQAVQLAQQQAAPQQPEQAPQQAQTVQLHPLPQQSEQAVQLAQQHSVQQVEPAAQSAQQPQQAVQPGQQPQQAVQPGQQSEQAAQAAQQQQPPMPALPAQRQQQQQGPVQASSLQQELNSSKQQATAGIVGQQQAAAGKQGVQVEAQRLASAGGAHPAPGQSSSAPAAGADSASQQAAALLAEAQKVGKQERPWRQLRAVMQALRMVEVEPSLLTDYTAFYIKLPLHQQDLQSAVIKSLLQRPNGAKQVQTWVWRKASGITT